MPHREVPRRITVCLDRELIGHGFRIVFHSIGPSRSTINKIDRKCISEIQSRYLY